MNLLVLPVLIPLVAMTLCLFFGRSVRVQRFIAGAAGGALLPTSFYLLSLAAGGETPVLRLGDWPGSFGIVFVLDQLSALMLVLAAVTQASTWWFACLGAVGLREERGWFHPLFLLLAAAVNWAFLTADLFNLFVSFEIILISSYVLLTLNADRFNLAETIRFVLLNAVAGMLFLAASGLAYGRYGALNFADLALRVRFDDPTWISVSIGTLLLVVFAIKAALFPFFFWLPDSYPRAALGVLPYFAGMLTKVGVYCLFRVFTLVFRIETETWFSPLLLAIAGATMLFGVLGAVSRWSILHVLSFHIISQIGYMIFGLGLLSPLGVASGIFYIAHHILVKSTLFLIGGYILIRIGSDDLKKVGGLTRSEPILSLLFLAVAFSLAGIPPLSGFYGKFGLAIDGVEQGRWIVVTISILTSLLTLASMLKIWTYVFWGEPTDCVARPAGKAISLWPIVSMVLLSIAVALFSGPLFDLAESSALQLLDGGDYIEAVLGMEGLERFRAGATVGEAEAP